MADQRATSTGDPLPSDFFPGVEDDAAVRPLLDELATEVQAEMETSDGAAPHVHTELRVRRGSDGEPELVRFYWSRQVTQDDAPWGFAARTVYCDKRDRTPSVHVFPAEPALTMLAAEHGPLLEEGRPRTVEVLRYIPLRRVTFRFRDGSGLPPRVIAKAKRPSGLERAVTAFRAAEEAAMRRGAGALSVPRLLGHDSRRGVLYLEELPGQSLDVALHRLEVTEAMQRLGESHRDLQELQVEGELPHKRIADRLGDAPPGRHADRAVRALDGRRGGGGARNLGAYGPRRQATAVLPGRLPARTDPLPRRRVVDHRPRRQPLCRPALGRGRALRRSPARARGADGPDGGGAAELPRCLRAPRR